MAHGTHLFAWPTDANRAALEKILERRHTSGWVEIDAPGHDGASISRTFETAAVCFDLTTVTDSFSIEFFVGGQSQRLLSYSADDGWLRQGKPAPMEDGQRMKPWFAKRRLLANHDGYQVLDAFLGTDARPNPKLLAAIAGAHSFEPSAEWDFGDLVRTLARDRSVGVAGLPRVISLAGGRLQFEPAYAPAAETIELHRAPSTGPVAWKDLGVFFAVVPKATPFVPTADQQRLLTDDAIDDLRRAHESTFQERVFFWPTRAISLAIARQPLPRRADADSWKAFLTLTRDVDATIAALRAALGGRALGGDAVEALCLAWMKAGADPITAIAALVEL